MKRTAAVVLLLLAGCGQRPVETQVTATTRPAWAEGEAWHDLPLKLQILHPTTTTVPPTTRPAHRQFPATMNRIRGCESGDGDRNQKRAHPGNYKAENPRSTASGAWQILDGTWQGVGNVPESKKYRHASHAPRSVQDDVAWAIYLDRSTSPWNSSRGCWA